MDVLGTVAAFIGILVVLVLVAVVVLARQLQSDEVTSVVPDDEDGAVLATGVVLLERDPGPDDLARVRVTIGVRRIGRVGQCRRVSEIGAVCRWARLRGRWAPAGARLTVAPVALGAGRPRVSRRDAGESAEGAGDPFEGRGHGHHRSDVEVRGPRCRAGPRSCPSDPRNVRSEHERGCTTLTKVSLS